MNKSVSIVGGGLGGLAAAIHLALSDFKVELYEKNNSFGGKMNEIRMGEYRFDTGPSLITMPFVIEQLFGAAGHKVHDFFTLVKTDPICRYFFPDKTVFDASADLDTMLSAIEAISPPDVENYRRFLRYSKRIYDLTADTFLLSALHETDQLFRWKNLSTLLHIGQIDPFRTVHKAVSSFFKDPRLIQIFDRYSTYNGSDPFQAPATLNIIPWVEYGIGGYTIQGGLYRLVEALVRLAKELGVILHTNAPVEKILHRNGRISGLLVRGEKLPANIVLCNADIVHTMDQLIDGLPGIARKMNKFEPSLSGLVYLWGMKSKQLMFKQHNIIFSHNYRQEFMQIFKQLTAPDDPTLYISTPAMNESGHAPDKGKGMNAFVLLNMPYLTENQNWNDIVKKMRTTVLKKLCNLGIDANNHIEWEKVITPVDFYERYGSNRGSIYGISSNSRSMAFKRPANRARFLKGLFFAGGSVHPGGGVPLALLSGKIAAELINSNWGNG